MTKKLCLIILDGWGVGDQDNSNAVHVGRTPTIDHLEQWYPKTALQASGLAVGLPWGEAGNSEVGHIAIGAGFIPYQALPRINMAVKSGNFFSNPVLTEAAMHVRKNNSTMHLMGLLTAGSVHAYLDHIFALIEWARQAQVPHLSLHLFTDGRDSEPQEGAKLLQELFSRMRLQAGHISTIVGRHWAMDRDGKWDRIEKAYQCLVQGQGEKFSDPVAYLQEQYQSGKNDEFVSPAANEKVDGKIKSGDAVIFFNFREDSVRELTRAFLDENFGNFDRQIKLADLYFATFTQYEEGFPTHVLFPPIVIDWPLARILSENKFKQFHIGETEKYAHITYFINGLRETPYPGEERILVPSLSTDRFDDTPEMSSFAIKHHILRTLGEEKLNAMMVNFANADMVGHTGNFRACLKAVEAVDKCLGEIIPRALEKDWTIIITADHGNIEHKVNLMTGEPLTEHTENPVPFYLIGKEFKLVSPNPKTLQKEQIGGLLADVAPTILNLLGLTQPQSMTGQNLLPLLTK